MATISSVAEGSHRTREFLQICKARLVGQGLAGNALAYAERTKAQPSHHRSFEGPDCHGDGGRVGRRNSITKMTAAPLSHVFFIRGDDFQTKPGLTDEKQR